jgi:HAD superfamily hydrolase (TIGR01509 family)
MGESRPEGRLEMSPAQHGGVTGVVFDCDGVLADTTPCWEGAFASTARGFGVELSGEQLLELRGAALSTGAAWISAWSRRSPAPGEVQELLRGALVRAIDTSDLAALEGARGLLGELHGNFPLGVASNSPRSVLLRVLARLGLTGYFATAVSAEDVERPKPAPDLYVAACAALRIDPRLSFAVEDSEIGVKSARAAGLTVIEVTKAPAVASQPLPRNALRVRSLADDRIPLLLRWPRPSATAVGWDAGPSCGLDPAGPRS